MEAKELRVGNLVSVIFAGHKTASYHKIVAEDIVDIANKKVTSTPEPIPLTPEILEKAGFTNEDKLHAGANTWWKEGMGEYLSFYYDGFLKYELTGRSVKYLHQLQNLYFALTGEELEIKL